MSHEKTPSNPSRKATARVKNPLPIPTVCPYCGGKVECVNNSSIYRGREYGEWPWVYMCENKDAYVGLHPFTNIPLGTLADKKLRKLRINAKYAFFKNMLRSGVKTRKEAYPILAKALNIPEGEAHFGWFGVDECKKVIDLFGRY